MDLEAIYREVLEMRAELSAHIRVFSDHVEGEASAMAAYQEWMLMAGPREAIRARLQFVEAWMEREKDRKALRRAVIEKSTIVALCAVLAYVGQLAWNDIQDVFRIGVHK